MAHELDITDGTVSFADSRTDAWHRLGQSVGHTMTAPRSSEGGIVTGIDGIEWIGDSVRWDIAGDSDASLLAVGFLGDAPVVTTEAFRRYVEHWTMGPGTVIEGDGALIHDSYTERFVFPAVGMIGGEAVYAMEGFGRFTR